MDTTIPNDEQTMTTRAGGYTSASGEWKWTEDYAFHRHCQKTVCSAYGYTGNGKTWSTLSPNGESSWGLDLVNI